MAKLLIVYASHYGQTERIATHVARQLQAQNVAVDCWPIKQFNRIQPNLSEYTQCVLMAAVYRGRHRGEILEFIARYKEFLNALPCVLCSVSMAAASSDETATKKMAFYVEDLQRRASWEPSEIEYFAGRVSYRSYNLILRWIMKRIMLASGHSTDTSRDHEYTNWSEVDAFVAKLADRN